MAPPSVMRTMVQASVVSLAIGGAYAIVNARDKRERIAYGEAYVKKVNEIQTRMLEEEAARLAAGGDDE